MVDVVSNHPILNAQGKRTQTVAPLTFNVNVVKLRRYHSASSRCGYQIYPDDLSRFATIIRYYHYVPARLLLLVVLPSSRVVFFFDIWRNKFKFSSARSESVNKEEKGTRRRITREFLHSDEETTCVARLRGVLFFARTFRLYCF